MSRLPQLDLEVAGVWSIMTGAASAKALRHAAIAGGWADAPPSEVFRRWWTGENLPDLTSFTRLSRALRLEDPLVFAEAVVLARGVKASKAQPARGVQAQVLAALQRDGGSWDATGNLPAGFPMFRDEALKVLEKLQSKGWVVQTSSAGRWQVTPAGSEALAARGGTPCS